MTDKDEIIIGKFFEQASRVEIEDNGFSRRVMRSISPRPNWAYRLWTAACVVGIVAFIIAMRVPQLLLVYVEVAMRIAMINPERVVISLPLIYAAIIGATAWGGYKALARA